MKEYLNIGLNSYGFHIETGLVDVYLSSTALVLAVALVIALRIRKVITSRKK